MSTSLPPYLQLISYSALEKLHECPRKFQLDRLNAWRTDNTQEESLTFAFGHAVGSGIQAVFEGHSEEEIIFYLWCLWPISFELENEKQEKSFYHALIAVRNFYHSYHDGEMFKDYELAYIEDKPGIEYSFKLLLPQGVSYRGAMDIILIHKETRQLIVVEVKTTSSHQVDPAQYANSNQAISYSTILGHAFPELVSYTVYYLVYYTHAKTFEMFPFTKTIIQQARWVQDLVLDIRLLVMYHEADRFPPNGAACLDKYRKRCKFFDTCQLNTPVLPHQIEQKDKMKEEEEKEYYLTLDVRKLLEDKGSQSEREELL